MSYKSFESPKTKHQRYYAGKKCQIISSVDQGTYGEVFRVVYREMFKAMKEAKYDKKQYKGGIPRHVLTEISVLTYLKHPNIITIDDVFLKSGQISFIMPYYEQNMADLISQPIIIPKFIIKKIMFQLLQAVNYLHVSGFIHRDLKPQNVMIARNAHDFNIKLIDFGSSLFVSTAPILFDESPQSLWYRAPEMLLEYISYDYAIDIWSIGCIFAELFNQDPLLNGRDETRQIIKMYEMFGSFSEKIESQIQKILPQTYVLPKSRINLEKVIVPILSSEELELLNNLLETDPHRRILAYEALQLDYFAEYQLPNENKIAGTKNVNQIQHVKEDFYSRENLQSLFRAETIQPNGFLNNFKSINEETCIILFDWLISVGEEYAISFNDLTHSFYLLNKVLHAFYISQLDFSRKKLQLYGLVCLNLSIKINSDIYLEWDDFAYLCKGDIYKKIRRIEKKILKLLYFQLIFPNPMLFLEAYYLNDPKLFEMLELKSENAFSSDIQQFVNNLVSLAIIASVYDLTLFRFKPSLLVASAIYFVKTFKFGLKCDWILSLQKLTKCDMNEILECADEIRKAIVIVNKTNSALKKIDPFCVFGCVL